MYFGLNVELEFFILGTKQSIEVCVQWCIALLLTTKYSRAKQQRFASGAIVGLFGMLIMCSCVNRYLDTFPRNSATPCQHFACLLSSAGRELRYAKISLSAINITLAICFLSLIKFKLDCKNKSIRRINNTVV